MKEKFFPFQLLKITTYTVLSLHKMERVFPAMEVYKQMLKLQSFHKILLTMSECFLYLSYSIPNNANAERADRLVTYSTNNSTLFSFEIMEVKIYLWTSINIVAVRKASF